MASKMKLAQSRATLTALADLKQPRQPNFIVQQNLAMNQQINTSMLASSDPAKPEIPTTKILEAERGKRLDT